MKKVALQFDTPQQLYIFRRVSQVQVIRTDVLNLVIYCKISEDNINLAVNHYGAKVKELQE
jgi:hypothetical protein